MKTTNSDFDAAVGVDTVAGWDAFLKQHPVGFYADLARERKARLEKQDKLANQKSAFVSLSPPTENVDRAPAMDLPKALQTELRRVGCNKGNVDGQWNAASQAAMELFNKHAGMWLDVKVASADALDVVKNKAGRICPLLCDHGFKPQGETCVKIECESGFHLSNDNTCERESRGNSRKDVLPAAALPNRTPSRSIEPGAVEGTASAMQRADRMKNEGKYSACMGALPGCYGRAIKKMGPDQARAWCSRKPTC